MAKLIDVSLVAAFSVVAYALMLVSVSGARDISYDDSSAQAPWVEAPWVDPLPPQCRMISPCADFLGNLIATRNMPRHRDAACCREMIQSTKYCWEKLMDVFEEDSFYNLHPWAENVWDKCVAVANSPAQAPSVDDSPEPEAFKFPEECNISAESSDVLEHLVVTKTMPSKNEAAFCKEVVKTKKFCWEMTMALLENPNFNANPFTDLHPWAENTWDECVSLANELVLDN